MKKSPLSTVNLFFILIGSVGILTACCDSSNENSDYNLDSEKMENVLFHDSRLSKLADSLNVDEEEISDSLRASENVDLDTFFLKDKSLLYYQVNNDSLWLTLERKNKSKLIIWSNGFGMVELHYRLGYQFKKEFNNSLLFRYGCPANGPCDYYLISKRTGEVLKSFPELIYSPDMELYDYLVYFSEGRKSFIFENINTKHRFEVPHHVPDLEHAITPEYDYSITLNKKQNLYVIHYRNVVDGKWQDFHIPVNPMKYN